MKTSFLIFFFFFLFFHPTSVTGSFPSTLQTLEGVKKIEAIGTGLVSINGLYQFASSFDQVYQQKNLDKVVK